MGRSEVSLHFFGAFSGVKHTLGSICCTGEEKAIKRERHDSDGATGAGLMSILQ